MINNSRFMNCELFIIFLYKLPMLNGISVIITSRPSIFSNPAICMALDFIQIHSSWPLRTIYRCRNIEKLPLSYRFSIYIHDQQVRFGLYYIFFQKILISLMFGLVMLKGAFCASFVDTDDLSKI